MFKDSLGDRDSETRFWGLVATLIIVVVFLGVFIYCGFRMGKRKFVLLAKVVTSIFELI